MSDAETKHNSVCSECGEPSTLQCPTCIKLGMPATHFCGKTCFSIAWPHHNREHKLRKKILDYRPPSFPYTGNLRPAFITQMRTVPKSVQKPDYALSGESPSEQKEKRDNKIHVNTKAEIKGIRAACKIGREILDIAGNMVAVGVTTEEVRACVCMYVWV
jgi:methionyl aminopeptidase